MRQEHTWISRCLITRADPSGITGNYRIQIACTARDEVELHQRLRDLAAQQSFNLKSVEYSRLIQDHLDRLDYYDQANVQLAATAAQHGFALGEPQAVDTETKTVNADGPSYLTISHQEVILKPDPGKPSWQQPWIDPKLKALLFSESHKTYLLVDATSRGVITTTFDLEDYDDIEMRSLYGGQLAQELKQQAPYVLDLTLSTEQLADDDQVPKFHRDFFSKHWGKNTGIFLHSQQSIDKIVFHLKKFIKIQNADGQWFYFRFFDPRTMNHYLQAIQRWPQRIAKWYGATGEESLIKTFYCEDNNGEQVNGYQLCPDHQLKHTGKIELTPIEFQFFQDFRWQQSKKQIIAEVIQDFPKETERYEREELDAWCEQGKTKGYQTPRALYDYCYAVLMAKNHGFDLSEIEQYLSEKTTSHLEKSKLLYQSTRDAVERYTTGIKT